METSEGMKIIGETAVGSHMWGMNHKGSDLDLFRIFVEDTKRILNGTPRMNSVFFQDKNKHIDTSEHEAKKVIEEVIKGNYSYITCVLSPVVRYKTKEFEDLKYIVNSNVTKKIYFSIDGMAKHNYKKFIKSGIDVSESRCNKIIRILDFGIRVLRDGIVMFSPVEGGTPEMIVKKQIELNKAYKKSILPEKVNEKQFRDWLVRVRLKHGGGLE